MRHYPDLPPMRSVELSDAELADADCVLIATHHRAYDWHRIGRAASLIVDTRGAMRGVEVAGTLVCA